MRSTSIKRKALSSTLRCHSCGTLRDVRSSRLQIPASKALSSEVPCDGLFCCSWHVRVLFYLNMRW